MTEVPSSYLIDKALKAKQATALQEAQETVENKHAALTALVGGLSTPEEGENALVPLDSPSMQERVENAQDVTLTDLEKTLTERQLKFAWNLARMRATGKGTLTSCAQEAGYSEGSASKEGSALARNPVICQVVRDRLPGELRLKRVKNSPHDFVLEKALMIFERATQEEPVLGKDGMPTGYHVHDAGTALRSLELIAKITGIVKTPIELTGQDGDAIKIDARVVATTALDLSERIKLLGTRKTPPVEDVK